MASTDATGLPIKNQAYRVTFPIFDADGDLVTGATGLDSEVSKDAGTFADCTSEATEIATSSGMYFLDLTATEMNADTVAVIVKTTSVGAKTTPIVLYPAEPGDIKANVVQWLGTAPATPTVAGVPEVDITHHLGTAVATPTIAGVPEVDLTHISGDPQSATDLKDFVDAGYDPATNKVEGVKLADSLTAVAAGGISAASLAADMDSYTGKLSVVPDAANTTDRWTMVWFKNGVPLTAGVTSPTLQVIKHSDGTDLIASTAMTQEGSTESFTKDESTNQIVAGASYEARAQATIGGATRTWVQTIGKPS